MSPTFPQFKKLEIDDREALIEFTSKFPDYTEFNFSYMFLWDLREPLSFSFLNGNLVVRFIDISSGKPFLCLLGDNMIDETMDVLLEYAEIHGCGSTLQNIPEAVIQSIKNKDRFSVVEDARYHDYVLSIHEIAHMKGSKFVKKRNLVHVFSENEGHHTTSRELDLSSVAVRNELHAVLRKWHDTYDRSEHSDIEYEFQAIERAINHHKRLGLRCFGTYIADELESFTIFEIVDTKTVIVHFDKANTAFRGLSEHHKHTLSKHLVKEHMEIINYQDDMGIDELRQSKQSYRPIGFLRKYQVAHSVKHHVARHVARVTI